MKTLLKPFAIVAMLVFSMAVVPKQAAAQPRVSVSFDLFHNELSPYGNWFRHPQYGDVWRPYADQGFRPYATDGHWVWTDDDEWTWYSDFNWGWAPFHYGRWDYDDYDGWFWIPDYDWAPAWVAWRSGDDYYGWAPLRPGISININIGGYAPPDYYWNFTSRRYMTDYRIYDHCYSPRMNRDYLGRTTIIQINNYGGRRNGIWGNSPRREEVERYTHERINPVSFGEHERFGRSGGGQVRGNSEEGRGNREEVRGNREEVRGNREGNRSFGDERRGFSGNTNQPGNGGRNFDNGNRFPADAQTNDRNRNFGNDRRGFGGNNDQRNSDGRNFNNGNRPPVSPQTDDRGQGRGNREEVRGNREQGTGNSGQGTGGREQGAGNTGQGTGGRVQGGDNRPRNDGPVRSFGNERGNNSNNQPYNGGRSFDNGNRQPQADRQPQGVENRDQGKGNRGRRF